MNYIKKLLNGQKVEWKTLGEVAELKRGRVISKTFLAENMGDFPVYSSQTLNNGEIGKIDTFDFEGDFLTWTTDGAYAGTIFKRKGKFSITNVCGLIDANKSILNLDFLYHWLSITTKKYVYYGMGNPKLMSNQIAKIPIPIPPLSVQREIAEILDKFTKLETELKTQLEKELELRKKQYAYYRDKLLTFDNKVEWKTLGEVAEYSKTRISYEQLNETNYVGVDNLLQNCAGKTLSNYVPNSGNSTEFIKDDILIGNIRPYLKKIWQADCVGGTNGDVLVIRISNKALNPRYLYQVLADDNFFQYNMKHAKGAKMPRGNKEAILKYKIPIPPLSEQRRIAEILDKFDTLTNSLTDGIPKEITLRRKQYEYYRSKLLAFDNV